MAADEPRVQTGDPTVLLPRDRHRVDFDMVVEDVLPVGQSDAAPRDSGAFLAPSVHPPAKSGLAPSGVDVCWWICEDPSMELNWLRWSK